MYPRSGFRSGEHPPKPPFWKTTLLATPYFEPPDSFADLVAGFFLIFLSTSDFQSEVGEVFGEIGGELPAKFGRRFSSFFCWGKSAEAYSTKTPPQISPSNFTTRFWVVAGPIFCGKNQESKN